MAAGVRTRSLPMVAAGLLAVAGLSLVNPNTTHLPLCPLHAMTGLWCPLCGSTRAGYALLHGRFGTALGDNALFVGALPLLVLLWFWRAAHGGTPGRCAGAAGGSASRRSRGYGIGWRPLPSWWCWPALVIGLAFGVLRNLPAGSWLAPPG